MFRLTLAGLILATIPLAQMQQLSANDGFDNYLARHTPMIREKLQRGGFKTIAVLPFRLITPKNGASLEGSLVQSNFALKLERALAMYNDPDDPLQIVFNGWTQALKADPNADFTDLEGRKKLFNIPFELPVNGSGKVHVDAFLTGVICPGTDYRTTKIKFELVSSERPEKPFAYIPKDHEGRAYVINTDRHMLVAMGKGFSISRKNLRRGDFSDDNLMDYVAAEEDWSFEQEKKWTVENPIDRIQIVHNDDERIKQSLIRIDVLYDGQIEPLTMDTSGGRYNATIADPEFNQKVTFKVENLTDEVLGLVLSVNGVNTLYMGDATQPSTASKWVLAPRKKYTISGFYKDLKTKFPIKGISDSESQQMIAAGGMDPSVAGLIHATVFREVNRQSGPGIVGNGQGLSGGGTGGNGTGGISSGGNGGEVTGSGNTGQNEKPTLNEGPKTNGQTGLEIIYNESPDTGMNLSLIRGGSKKSTGSFHPVSVDVKAQSWSDLSQKIAKSAGKLPAARGLMAPGNTSQGVDLTTRGLKPVEIAESIIIRYYSVLED